MMRRRAGPPPGAQQNNNEDDSSSSEEDVFSKLSRKHQKKKQKKNPPSRESDDNKQQEQKQQQTTAPSINQDAKPAPAAVNNPALPLATTSSMKRHHKEMSGSRKAKMDALLQELEQDKKHIDHTTVSRERQPMKKGSFVDPGDEHITTNIFVGNLAPTLTEEEVTNLFRQFGRKLCLVLLWLA